MTAMYSKACGRGCPTVVTGETEEDTAFALVAHLCVAHGLDLTAPQIRTPIPGRHPGARLEILPNGDLQVTTAPRPAVAVTGVEVLDCGGPGRPAVAAVRWSYGSNTLHEEEVSVR